MEYGQPNGGIATKSASGEQNADKRQKMEHEGRLMISRPSSITQSSAIFRCSILGVSLAAL